MSADISYSQSFLEWEAAISAGLSLHDWESGVYDNKFKARVIAWYSLHNLVKLHSESAVSEYAKREAAKAKRK